VKFFYPSLHSAYVLIENLKRKKIAWTLDNPLLASTYSKLVFFFKHLLFFFLLFELLFPGDGHWDLFNFIKLLAVLIN